MSAYADLVPQYQRLRRLSRQVNDALLKEIPRDVMDEAGRKLGILRRGVMVFDCEEDMALLADACLHDIRRQGRTVVEREPAPDRNDEYLFYQSLLGVWPAELPDAPLPAEAPPELVQRMRRYMQKATKEAKRLTSWLSQNGGYDEAVSARFIARIEEKIRTGKALTDSLK